MNGTISEEFSLGIYSNKNKSKVHNKEDESYKNNYKTSLIFEPSRNYLIIDKETDGYVVRIFNIAYRNITV